MFIKKSCHTLIRHARVDGKDGLKKRYATAPVVKKKKERDTDRQTNRPSGKQTGSHADKQRE